MRVQPSADVYEITGGNPDEDHHWVHQSQWLQPVPTALCGYNDQLAIITKVTGNAIESVSRCPVCDLLARAMRRSDK